MKKIISVISLSFLVLFLLVSNVIGSSDSVINYSGSVLWNPSKIIIDKELYKIELEPIPIQNNEGWGPKFLKFKLLNKKSKEFKILWTVTNYLKDGKVDGIFCEYKGKTKSFEDESIPSGQSTEKTIAPENLSRLDLSTLNFFRRGSWWYYNELPIGKNGIMIKMMIDEKEYTENSEFDFTLKEYKDTDIDKETGLEKK
ncbi:MAG: hypothetical protein WC401_10950 [Bacteroidales bacterium]|jgi:hypothetical protein